MSTRPGNSAVPDINVRCSTFAKVCPILCQYNYNGGKFYHFKTLTELSSMGEITKGALLIAAFLLIVAYGAHGSFHRFGWVSWLFIMGPPSAFFIWGWRKLRNLNNQCSQSERLFKMLRFSVGTAISVVNGTGIHSNCTGGGSGRTGGDEARPKAFR